jgi:hypothetical protein
VSTDRVLFTVIENTVELKMKLFLAYVKTQVKLYSDANDEERESFYSGSTIPNL